MLEELETIVYKGYKIKVYPDYNPIDPRNDDNLGQMICFHRSYNLGDKHDYNSDSFDGWAGLAKQIEKDNGKGLLYPLYLYDHSGLRLKIGSFYGLLPQGHAEFDSGQVGFIFISHKRIKQEYGRLNKTTKARAEKVLRGEVETYDNYLSGAVYGYQIESPSGDNVDGCWGYFGDTEQMVEEAKSNIDHDIKSKTAKHIKKVKAQIKAGVGLDKRQTLAL